MLIEIVIQVLEAALQEAVRAEADSHSLASEEMDMDFHASHIAPDPSQLAPDEPAEEVEETPRSPEYSPVLHHTAPETIDREEDEYEPPEATPPAEAEVPESPPFSPAPPKSVHEVADVAMGDVDQTQESDEEGEITVEDTLPLPDGSSQGLLQVTKYYAFRPLVY